MKTVLHKADSRGGAEHAWLSTRHTFSFANYYDPSRMGFGTLRVLNDDLIAPGKGFGMHPHDNMEIITIPLSGMLEHKDSMGNVGVVKVTDEDMDVQVMSAGTGIVHSEYNASVDTPVSLLQIWVMPNAINVKPRYEQVSLTHEGRINKLQQIVSPEGKDAPLWIHQTAWFYLSQLEVGTTVEYKSKAEGNGLYVFVIHGDVQVDEHKLGARDGLGLYDFDRTIPISFTAKGEGCEFLLMDLPMV